MSNEKQQTAVDLLWSMIPESTQSFIEHQFNGYKQAKEMEKQKMIEFGELVWKNLLRSDKIMKPIDVYNETYGGNK